MSAVITIAEAQARLRELITNLAPGEEIVITDDQRAVAKLVGPPCTAATGNGTSEHAAFPQPGTLEWHTMNERRAVLIQKKCQVGLTDDERIEFDALQRHTHEALERTFPRPGLSSQELAVIKRAIGFAPRENEA